MVLISHPRRWRRIPAPCLGWWLAAWGLNLLGAVSLSTGMGRHDFREAAAWVDSQRVSAYEGNVVVIVESEAGQRLWEYSGGSFTPDTRREVASASKWFAAAVVLGCADRGWVDLDRPIEQSLPVFRASGNGTFTPRQAFGMVSGLFAEEGAYELNPLLTHGLSVAAIARNVPQAFPPGTRLAYDGSGMQVAGFVAAQARGVDWNGLAREVLLDPLGLTRSAWDYFGALNPAVAGGLSTTPNEYMRFLRMVLAGGVDPMTGRRVLSQAAVELMFRSQTDGLPIHFSPWTRWDDLSGGAWGRVDYGFGTWTLERDPLDGHPTAMSSPGAFKTFPWVDRRRGVAALIFVRVDPGAEAAVEAHRELIRRINAALDRGPWRPESLRVVRGEEGRWVLVWDGPGDLAESEDLQTWRRMEPRPSSGFAISARAAAGFFRLEAPANPGAP